MTREAGGDLVKAAKALFLPTLALLAVVAFVPGRAELAIRVYALVLCVAGLLLSSAALRRAYPAVPRLRPPPSRTSDRRTVPEALSRIEHEVALGHASSFDLHYRLRPRVRGLADELLLARRGVSLDDEDDRARRALGEVTWELVRKHRPPPEDRLARGIPLHDLERVVVSLERL